MNITVTDREECKKELRLEIPGETVRAETDKIAEKLAKQINVPGFRRGHVPKSVVKTRFRKELRDEMLSQLLPHSLGDAIREKELKVVGQPSVEDLKFKDDESIDVIFNIEVAPEFALSNYKQLPITKREYKVRDQEIDRAIEHLREGQAQLVPVEDRASQSGDIITVNLTGQVQAEGEQAGPAAEEINQQDVTIELGASGVLNEFNEALTGARVADARGFTVEYPAEYKPEKLAGKRVDYNAEVIAVRAKELPEIDDEFASTVSEEFQSLDDLKADIRSKLEREAAERSEAELRNQTMERLVDRNRFAVPEFVVDKQIDSRMKTLLRQLSGGGMDPRQMKVDWQGVRESQRERAEREVRGSFILDRIAETEDIQVSDDELTSEIQKYAVTLGQTPEALRARLTKEDTLDSIREQVRHRKALDLVIASAEIRTEEIEGLGTDEATGEVGRAES